PGASSIDERGDAAFFGEVVGIDSQRGAAPINVGMQVDEARRNDHPGDVFHLRMPRPLDLLAEGRDPTAGKGNVHKPVYALRRIDHPSVLKDQIEFLCLLLHGSPCWLFLERSHHWFRTPASVYEASKGSAGEVPRIDP